jgi:hypothetical protein
MAPLSTERFPLVDRPVLVVVMERPSHGVVVGSVFLVPARLPDPDFVMSDDHHVFMTQALDDEPAMLQVIAAR